jgi:hypothetical protein
VCRFATLVRSILLDLRSSVIIKEADMKERDNI